MPEKFELVAPPLAALLQSQTRLRDAHSVKEIVKAWRELRGLAPDADLVLACWRAAMHLDIYGQRQVLHHIETSL